IRIVAMTAHAMKGDRERCLAAGMDGYLSKPIRSKDLIDVVEGNDKSTPEPPSSRGKNLGTHSAEEGALLDRVDGNLDIAIELASAFLEESPKLLDDLFRAVSKKDAKTMNYAAHALKGSLANFGAQDAVDLAFTLEKLGKAGQVQPGEAVLQKLAEKVQ